MQSKTYLPLILALLVALCPSLLRAGDKKAVAAGYFTSYIIKKDGSLWAFGHNNDACVLGDGTYVERTKPVKILDGIKQVASGFSHTLALGTDGTVYAWGLNNRGQLGDGTSTNRLGPVKIASGVRTASTGAYHSMWVTDSGDLVLVGKMVLEE